MLKSEGVSSAADSCSSLISTCMGCLHLCMTVVSMPKRYPLLAAHISCINRLRTHCPYFCSSSCVYPIIHFLYGCKHAVSRYAHQSLTNLCTDRSYCSSLICGGANYSESPSIYSANALFNLPNGWIMRFNYFLITIPIIRKRSFRSNYASSPCAEPCNVRAVRPLCFTEPLGLVDYSYSRYRCGNFRNIFCRKPYPKFTRTNLDSGLSFRALPEPVLPTNYALYSTRTHCCATR